MTEKRSERARDKEVNRQFEKQGRRLNRQWTRNAISGVVILIILIIVLQFTPYRDIPMDVFNAAKRFVTGVTSGKAAPVEPNPTYW